MKRFTKALSMLLAIVMVVGLLPLSVIAEDIHNTHTVEFKLNYNGAHKIPSQKVTDGECAVQPEDVTREGWIFEYWYVKNGDGIQKFDLSQPIMEDVTLYARWDEDISFWGPIWNRNILNGIAESEKEDESETDEDVIYTVTFEANGDNVSNLPAVQYVQEGNCAEEPDAPTRDGYQFFGWSAGKNGILYDFNTAVTENIRLYALWTKNGDGPSVGSENEGSSVYSITGLSVQGDSVSVTVNAVEECKLVVVFYADDDEMNTVLATVASVVPAGVQMEAIDAKIADSLPEYFIAVAQLFDAKNEALCNTYTCIEYTQAYEEFAAKTIHDFPGKTVLNFDESPDSNFGVLADNVKTVVSSDDENVLLEYSGNQYVFENVTEDITGLSKGDIICIESNTGEDYLVKVETVSTQNGKTTITPDSDTVLNEFYSYLKVDMEVYAQDIATPQTFNMMRGNIIDKDESYTSIIGFSGSYDNEFFEFKISGNGELKVRLVVLYDLELFGEDYCKFDVIATTKITIATDVIGKLETPPNGDEGETKIKLPEVLIPFGVTGLAAKASPALSLKFKLHGGLYMSEEDKKFVTGFTFNTIDGYHKVEDDDEDSTPEIDVGGKIEITVGPEIEIGISFLDEAFEGKIVFFAGGRLKGETLHSLVDKNEVRHGCTLCIDGTVDFVANVKAKLTYKLTKNIKGTPLDATIIERSIHLFDYVFSVINDLDSMFHGSAAFVLGVENCPNIAYRVNVYAIDAAGNKLSNCPITITKVGSDKEYSGNSPYTTWLYYGEYAITAEIGGKTVSDTFEISNSAKNIYISENGISDAKLIGRYYCATAPSSWIEFTDQTTGILHIVPYGTVSDFSKEFTYVVNDDIITITSVDKNFGYKENGQWIKSLKFKIKVDDGIVLESLNSWGNVVKGEIFQQISISAKDLVGRTYTQTTSIDDISPIPSIRFTDTNSGVITLNYLEGYNSKEFTYEIIGDRVKLYSKDEEGLYVIPGIALEMEFVFLNEDALQLANYMPRIIEGVGIHLGATGCGDVFQYNH